MLLATLHERAFAEPIPDRLAQRLAAVDDEQVGPLRIEPALDEVVEQLPT